MTTAPKLPEGLEPVAWGTTRTTDGKQILSEMCVATNPAYVKVHNQHLWEPLVRLSDAQAALQALAAEIAALRQDAARYRWLKTHGYYDHAEDVADIDKQIALAQCPNCLGTRSPSALDPEWKGRCECTDAAIDSALLAAKEAKQ
jgi:hypothetical protein